jgi:predicted Ser/Thr protein kinase
MLGPAHVFGWIRDIALGVEELESLGIYHADLWISNTIRIIVEENELSFKIIDFDKAFKVFPTEAKDKAFESTKNLLKYWLSFKFDGVESKPPLDEIEVNDS